jgi:sec-independent protein translocase protein TatB
VLPNIGWGETLILLVAALVILGPERLPGAIQWTFGAIRKVRDYAGGATSQLRSELGPEFDELRKPLAELQRLRGMSPRSVLVQHLLDGDDSLLDDVRGSLPDLSGLSGGYGNSGAGTSAGGYHLNNGSAQEAPDERRPVSPPHAAGERPPIDTDAT